MATEHDPHHTHHHHHGAHGASLSTPTLATHATLHCLIGCGIGELVGLAIGVSLGLSPRATMTLATALGFLSGYTFGLWPLVRQGMSWMQAFRLIWFGETVSIAVMELAMNFIDYRIGGVQTGSVMSGQFWIGFLLALPAGFLAAWPVNYLLLTRGSKPETG